MADLYLFDIDGTLVNLNMLHVKAYKQAFQKFLGLRVSREKIFEKFGLPEKVFNEELLKDLGINNKDKIEKIISLHNKIFVDHVKKSFVKPLPGVLEFLKYLKNNGDYIGIVTGNMPKPGKSILKQANLLKHFSVFSYDTGFPKREFIVRNAIKIAKQKGYKFKKVVVIGDSPYDIKAGKAVGAFTVGVTTGNFTKKDLKGADLILNSMMQYRKINTKK